MMVSGGLNGCQLDDIDPSDDDTIDDLPSDDDTKEDLPSDDDTIDDLPTQPTRKRRGRGPSLLDSSRKRTKQPKIIDQWGYNKQPIGEWSAKFTTHLGKLVRSKVNINMIWKKVPNDLKDQMWAELQRDFIVDESKKGIVIAKMCNYHNKWRHQLRAKYIRKTISAGQDNREPYEVYEGHITKEDWLKFKASSETPEFQELSDKNKERAKMYKHHHVMGRFGYAKSIPNWKESGLIKHFMPNAETGSTVSTVGDSEVSTVGDSEEIPRYVYWFCARTKLNDKNELEFPVNSEEMQSAKKQLDKVQEDQANGTWNPDGRHDMLSAVVGKPDHSGRARGFGGNVGYSEVFGREKKSKSQGTCSLSQEQLDKLKAEILSEYESPMREKVDELKVALERNKEDMARQLRETLAQIGISVPSPLGIAGPPADTEQSLQGSTSTHNRRGMAKGNQNAFVPNPRETLAQIGISVPSPLGIVGPPTDTEQSGSTSTHNRRGMAKDNQNAFVPNPRETLAETGPPTISQQSGPTSTHNRRGMAKGNQNAFVPNPLDTLAQVCVTSSHGIAGPPTISQQSLQGPTSSHNKGNQNAFVPTPRRAPRSTLVKGNQNAFVTTPRRAPREEATLVKGNQNAIVPNPQRAPREEATLVKGNQNARVPNPRRAPREEATLVKGNQNAIVPNPRRAPREEATLVKGNQNAMVPNPQRAPREEATLVKGNQNAIVLNPRRAPREEATLVKGNQNAIEPNPRRAPREEATLVKYPLVNTRFSKRLKDDVLELHEMLELFEPNHCRFSVPLPQEMFRYTSHEFETIINREELTRFLTSGPLNISILQCFLLYISSRIGEIGAKGIEFLCPLICSHANLTKDKDATKAYLKRALLENIKSNSSLILLPYNHLDHWMLIVICPNVRKGYVFDPASVPGPEIILKELTLAFKIASSMEGNGRGITFSRVQCQKQPRARECGQYVMRYLYDIINIHHGSHDIGLDWSSNEDSYTTPELDETRNVWARYFIDVLSNL